MEEKDTSWFVCNLSKKCLVALIWEEFVKSLFSNYIIFCVETQHIEDYLLKYFEKKESEEKKAESQCKCS